MPRTIVGLLVAALVTTLTLATPAVGSAAAPRAATPAAVHWGHCPTSRYPDLARTRVECARLKVPMDYSDPGGRQITLEVSLLRHTSSASDYRGVILSNPGGPGGAGLDLPVQLAPAVPNRVGADYDWVGWDPRGVGASSPAIHCQRDYFNGPRRDYTPTSKRIMHYWLKRAKGYAAACANKYPRLLDHMTTVDSAKDMEQIRLALGVDTLSYYGFSYGTYLGQVYSTLYPSHLKYMVLDSTVDPRKVWYDANLSQDKAFERAIRIYFRWVARYHRHFHLGHTGKAVYRRYDKDLARLGKHPKGRLGSDEFADAMTGAAYYRFNWVRLARAWHAYDDHRNATPMERQYLQADTPGDDNSYAVYNAVQCTDAHWPARWRTWRKDARAYARKYPFLTWSNTWYNAPCHYWGAKSHHPVTIDGTATPSVLLIDETLDAATPYSGSLEVRRRYPNSSLIAEPGGSTHADSLFGDRCVDNKIARYLATGERPARKPGNTADAKCKPLPDPRP